MSQPHTARALAGLWLGLLAASDARAEVPAKAEPGASPGNEVEEILITASGRPATVHATPLAVSAYAPDDLEARGVDELSELVQLSPSLAVTTTGSTTHGGALRIRGLGTAGNNIGLEASVASVIDGVPRSRAGHAFSDLLDVERVELVRGAESAVLARNGSLGAIYVHTKAPNLSELEGFVAVELGSHDHRRLSASVSGPIAPERLGARLAATWSERDGFLEDANRDTAYNNRERWSLRGNLAWQSERVRARLIADFRRQDEACCQVAWAVAGPTRPLVASLAGALGLGRDVPTASGVVTGRRWRVGVTPGDEPVEDVKDGGVSLELGVDLDGLELTSLTSWRKLDLRLSTDPDWSSAAILQPGLRRGQHQAFVNFSQELRATGSAGERLDWLAGVQGYVEDTTRRVRAALGPQGGLYRDALVDAALPALGALSQPGHYPEGAGALNESALDLSGWALFTHGALRVARPLDLTFGARYARERKGARVSIAGGVPGPIPSDPAELLPGQISNDPTTAAFPGATLPWCEQLSADGLHAVRTRVLASSCDHVSWRGRKREGAWSYHAGLALRASEAIHLYASYAGGSKAGGFNTDADAVDLVGVGSPLVAIVDGSRFDPERADTYEVGLKLALWGERLRLTLAGFYTEIGDFQLNVFTIQGFVLTNVDAVSSRGVELETLVSPLEGLDLTLALTYANARYDDDAKLCFPLQEPSGNINRCTPPGGSPGANDSPPGAFAEDFLLDGKRISHAPLWALASSLSYERALVGEWVAFGSLNVSYRGERNLNPALHPLAREGAQTFVNLRGGVRSPSGRWELALWATNLGDTRERVLIAPTPQQGGSLHAVVGPPRLWGGTLRYAF